MTLHGPGDWREHAACRGTDVNEWYPSSGAQTRPGPNAANDYVPAHLAEICRGCPVAEACCEHALRHEDHGVWSATSARQRKRIRRQRGIAYVDLGTPIRRSIRVARLEEEAAS